MLLHSLNRPFTLYILRFRLCSIEIKTLNPCTGWMGKKISDLRLKAATKSDERVRLMNEIISGIKVIKMYTWEKPFAYVIKCARKYVPIYILVLLFLLIAENLLLRDNMT